MSGRNAGAVRGMDSAFPISPGDDRAVAIEQSQGNRYGSAGLTIREELAGRAMAAIVGTSAEDLRSLKAGAAKLGIDLEVAVAIAAVRFADALLEELAK